MFTFYTNSFMFFDPKLYHNNFQMKVIKILILETDMKKNIAAIGITCR